MRDQWTLIELICSNKINPGKLFDLTLPLDQVAEGHRAMDEWRAIKTLLPRKGEERNHAACDREGLAGKN